MSLPPWWNNKGKKQNARSKKQEEKIAKRHGGRVQAGSGSSWRRPQDVVEDDYLVQAKYTDKKGYRISVEEWLQLRKDAFNNGREPLMEIDFSEYKVRLQVTEIPYE